MLCVKRIQRTFLLFEFNLFSGFALGSESELGLQLGAFIIMIVILSEQTCVCFIHRLSQLKAETVTESERWRLSVQDEQRERSRPR